VIFTPPGKVFPSAQNASNSSYHAHCSGRGLHSIGGISAGRGVGAAGFVHRSTLISWHRADLVGGVGVGKEGSPKVYLRKFGRVGEVVTWVLASGIRIVKSWVLCIELVHKVTVNVGHHEVVILLLFDQDGVYHRVPKPRTPSLSAETDQKTPCCHARSAVPVVAGPFPSQVRRAICR
jgi:hypothetical protein